MPEHQRLSTVINAYAQAHFTNICGVERALEKLNKEDGDDLIQAMSDRFITNRSLSLALADRSINVSLESFKRHRRGDCACES